jgi:beta-lactamase superfamily II metal-dependent hydrolase
MRRGRREPRSGRDRRGTNTDVIAPPPGELFSETNDNSVAILLTYGTARVLLAGDAEARENTRRSLSEALNSGQRSNRADFGI